MAQAVKVVRAEGLHSGRGTDSKIASVPVNAANQ
jgi:hypothetical protein